MTTDHRPTQEQIGNWLGISQPVVSRYARAGMPLGSLASASEWYDKNVHPRGRNVTDGRDPVRFAGRDGRYGPKPAAGGEVAPPPGIAPDADPDEVLRDMTAITAEGAWQLALSLAHVALPLVKAGRFSQIEQPLRQALRLVPKHRRAELLALDLDDESPDAIPMTVWRELAKGFFDRVDAMPEQQQESERVAATQMSPGDQERVVVFVYSIAAGEWAFNTPAAPPAAPKKKARRR
jgi:hypothetical protein